MKKRTLLLVGCLLLLSGCAAREYKVQPDARSQYDFAKAKYDDGKYDDAVLEFQKVLFTHPGLSYLDSTQYWFAMSYYMRKDYHLAAAELRRLITSIPGSPLADDAQFMIGKAYLEAAPGNPGLDQSDTEAAIKELEAFLEDYPFSDRREEGLELLTRAREKIMAKQLNAAWQYYRMGNLQSARLYYEDIITEHADSRYVPESLLMLARIDFKEKKYTDARDKLKNLLTAFPAADVAADAEKLRSKVEKKISEQAETIEPPTETVEEKSE